MADAPPPVDIDPDFEPLSRPRSCTWPLPRPELTEPGSSNTSSPAPCAQEPGASSDFSSSLGLLEEDYEEYAELKPACGALPRQQRQHLHHLQQQQQPGPQMAQPQQQVPHSGAPPLGVPAQRKITSSRRNAWGNMSYADLITKAIESSPEKRLTLSQIYDWMVKSVPYFNDKGDSNSSAGWKNSIRHNLSLHSRFVRIQNEGTGKSSWWMLNPEGGKNGKSPRRRAASMDNNNKFLKSKGRATKKKMSHQEGIEGDGDAPSSQYSNWLGSPNSHSNDDLDMWSSFRTRTSSDASTLSGHRSPFPPEPEDLKESDGHMCYPGAAAAKVTSPLPSLSEVSGPLSQHGSECVMESLLDNLHLLSPKAPLLGSDSSHSSNANLLQSSSFTTPGLTHNFHKSMYGQLRCPAPMQSLPETKAGFGLYGSQYACPEGLLKELLTTETNTSRDTMPSSDTHVSDVQSERFHFPSYSGRSHAGAQTGVKITNPPQIVPSLYVNLRTMQSQGSIDSRDSNICNMIPLTSLTSLPGAPHQMSRVRTRMELPYELPTHTNEFPESYSDGYRQMNSAHPHCHHPERLPSDLDNMSIERFECDLESVLHDTLMDGGGLDFNFEPTAGPHGFSQRVKTSAHSWVSS